MKTLLVMILTEIFATVRGDELHRAAKARVAVPLGGCHLAGAGEREPGSEERFRCRVQYTRGNHGIRRCGIRLACACLEYADAREGR